jgi:hypothetical protein
MEIKYMKSKIFWLMLIVVVVSGCGGGSSNGSSSSFDTSNNAPVFTSKNQVTVFKNNIESFEFDINASDNSEIKYYIKGEDAENFIINPLSGILTFNMDKYKYKQYYILKVIAEDTLGHQAIQDLIVIIIDYEDKDISFTIRDFNYTIEDYMDDGSVYVHILSTLPSSVDLFTFYDNNLPIELDNGTLEDGYLTLNIGKHSLEICENDNIQNCSIKYDIIISKKLEESDYSKIPIYTRSSGLTNDGSSNLIFATYDGYIYSLNTYYQYTQYIGTVSGNVGGLSGYKEIERIQENDSQGGTFHTMSYSGEIENNYEEPEGEHFIVYTDPATGNIYYSDIDNQRSIRIASTPFPDGVDVVDDKIYAVTYDKSGILSIFSFDTERKDIGRALGKLDTGIDDIVGISHTDRFLYILSESGKIYQTDKDTGYSVEIFNNDNLLEGKGIRGGLEAITILNDYIYISYIDDSSIYKININLKNYENTRG